MRPTAFVTSRAALPAAIALILLMLPLSSARAVERGAYGMEILVDGVPLQELRARGRTYVEALEGGEYSIRLTNHTADRIAVALAVDGLNSIDAKKTETRDASKWILGPHDTITVSGWQTGDATARRFFFTSEARSYGAWLGETRDLGIISAAVFREKRRRPDPIQRPQARKSDAPAERREARGDAAAPLPSDEMAATGIGRQFGHRVRRIPFEAEATPVARLDVRYEYREALVRLGVLPEPYACGDDALERRERARGFDDFEFAPDPFAPRSSRSR